MKDCVGWPGYYVDENGCVYSRRVVGDCKKLGPVHPLKPALVGKKSKKYYAVSLRRDGKSTTVYVHTLVLEAYIGPRPDGSIARHGKRGTLVNTADNLSWGTPRKNQLDRVRDGTSNRGSRGSAKLARLDVLKIRAYQNVVSVPYLAERFGVTRNTIKRILDGEAWNLPEYYPPYYEKGEGK
jgi:hypothetical protein